MVGFSAPALNLLAIRLIIILVVVVQDTGVPTFSPTVKKKGLFSYKKLLNFFFAMRFIETISRVVLFFFNLTV